MKGTYFLGNGNFEIREKALSSLGPDEVLVRVAACGVCGTDVHIYHGDKGSAEVHPPVILGHELAGIVERVGENVDLVAAEDHVAIDPNIYCGKCRPCRQGKKQLCENLSAIGVTRDGGFADYCVVPQTQCFKVDQEIPIEHAAMAEPLACCIHGIDRAGIRPGSAVCVIGGGAIGLMMVQLARIAGASSVVLSEPNAFRRKVALEIGVDAAIDPLEEDLAARYEEVTGIHGADVVIECVGNTKAVEQAFAVAGKGAEIVLFSVPKPDTFHPLSLDDVYHKELSVTGSMIDPDTFERAVSLLNERRLKLAPIITHAYPTDRLEDAIRMQMSDESIKVVVSPDLTEPVALQPGESWKSYIFHAEIR